VDSWRPSTLRPSTLTIGGVLAARAARAPTATAIVSPGLAPLDFEGLSRRIAAIGTDLRAAGIGTASRVGLALPRGPEAALMSVAVAAHATLLPINVGLAAPDLATEIERLRLDALLLPAGVDIPAWAGTDGLFRAGLFRVGRAVREFDEIVLDLERPILERPVLERPVLERPLLEQPVPVQPGRTPNAGEPVSPQSWAAIFKTSGTTGASKRVPVTHENLIEMACKMERWLGLTPADRSACIMPIHYNAGFKATLLAPLLAGCSVALPVTTAPGDFSAWLEKLRPTWLTAAPAYLQALVERLRRRPQAAAGHSLRFVLSTASYLPEATREELARLLGVPVVEFYGLCEAGMMTAPVLPPLQDRAGSVGRVPEGELAIVGEDGKPVRAGRTGQIMLSGPSVTPGYLMGDIEAPPTGLQDGWLPTGDLGCIDKDGFLSIAGRAREIVNRGGEKISPYDVEKALLAHPAVREAACFAVPHPRLGENVGAAVVLQPGAKATSRALIDFLYDRLAPFQMPRHVHLVDTLPVGPTGKISRAVLSARFAGRHDASPPAAAPLEIIVAEIWRRYLERSDIGLDDDFFEMGGDSLQATEMLLELEETTRCRIAPSQLRAELTIRQLCGLLAGAASARGEPMTQVRAGREGGTPLFLCHGDFLGWGFYGHRLAGLLEGDGPVYLLHSLIDPARGIESIEQMVAHYLPAIERAAPAGPLRLAGYCHGGLAALETAHRLEQAGRVVETVALIDTYSLNARPGLRALQRLAGLAGRLVPGPWGARIRRSAMTSFWVLATHLLRGDPRILARASRTLRSGSMRAWDSSQRTDYFRAMAKYLPAPLHAGIVCLLCQEYAGRREYAAAPWRRLAPVVREAVVPGEHNTCVSRHVGALADRLNRLMPAAAAPTLAVDRISGRAAP
jgi:acyl-CoA synthetase (AMP-forming)/AMP-acid ligase II/thioesterase domain-containing protein/acyl carrier protein